MPKRPVGDEIARVRDRRVRIGLADDRDRHAVDRTDRVRRKHRVAEVGRPDVLGEKFDLARKVLRHDLLHALGAEREFPVAGHHVDAQELAGVDHVLALRPQRGRRSLPRVAAVEQQRVRPRRFQSLDERGEMREAADLAVGPRRGDEIEIREGVRVDRSGLDAEVPRAALRRRDAADVPRRRRSPG